jgi:phospholipid/cholesterol/gamma-HCH transport system substrate-binding protein
MQKTTGNKIRLGIFVTVSTALFIAGIYFIGKRRQLFSDTFHISGIFKNVDGLQIGNNVHFSGINVGIVEDINQITDSTVKVDMSINMDTKKYIKKNAKALIGSDGLMGNKIVQIIPGPACNQELSDNDFIKTVQSVSVDEILEKIKVTADNGAIITNDLAIIMENIKNGKGTMGKLFMDSTLAKIFDDAMINIKQGAGGFKRNMDAAGHNVLLRGYIKNKKNDTDKK